MDYTLGLIIKKIYSKKNFMYFKSKIKKILY